MRVADDILTGRLVLRLMEGDVVDACLAGDLARAGALLGTEVPADVLEQLSGLEYARVRLAEDPLYREWSARAILLADTLEMVGRIRFHSRPDPEYLQPFARGAVEFGYR